jgi:hypothetical protein
MDKRQIQSMENGAKFFKSSYSSSGNCVEVSGVASAGEPLTKDGHSVVVAIRDSKNQAGPMLHFTRGEWEAFIAGVKDGEFDLGL